MEDSMDLIILLVMVILRSMVVDSTDLVAMVVAGLLLTVVDSVAIMLTVLQLMVSILPVTQRI
jgi:hypothetical protein